MSFLSLKKSCVTCHESRIRIYGHGHSMTKPAQRAVYVKIYISRNSLQYISDARVCGNKAKGLIIFVLAQCMQEAGEGVFVV